MKRVLNELQTRYRLALISDAQSCFAMPEIHAVGLNGYFDPIIISSRYGFRKPDSRLFKKALDRMGLEPNEVIGIGNDMFRDIHGAKQLGIRSIFIDSNQGTKAFKDVIPDYRVTQFDNVVTGVAALG